MNIVDPEIEAYCLKHTTPLPPVFSELHDETYAKTELPQMQVGVTEGSFLKLLVALVRPRIVVELGTFTGFSSLAMAEALPEDGKIITCDIDPETTEIARKYWKRSPHGAQIELRLGPALDTLKAMKEKADLAFIDADKTNYANYWEALVPKMNPGGLIVVDNVLWSGRVLAPRSKMDEDDRAIADFNERALQDRRMEVLMLPIRDGILVARRGADRE